MYPCFQKGHDIIKEEDYWLPYIDVRLKDYYPSPVEIEELKRHPWRNSFPKLFTNVDLEVSVAIPSSNPTTQKALQGVALVYSKVIPHEGQDMSYE